MLRPLLAEPPAKRQRALGEDEKNMAEVDVPEDDEEFRRLEAVSTVQDELNALEEEEAQQVRCTAVVYSYTERTTPVTGQCFSVSFSVQARGRARALGMQGVSCCSRARER